MLEFSSSAAEVSTADVDVSSVARVSTAAEVLAVNVILGHSKYGFALQLL